MNIVAGVLVVDSSTGIAGPYATKLFADAGAEGVESPEDLGVATQQAGDEDRQQGDHHRFDRHDHRQGRSR